MYISTEALTKVRVFVAIGTGNELVEPCRFGWRDLKPTPFLWKLFACALAAHTDFGVPNVCRIDKSMLGSCPLHYTSNSLHEF